VSKFLIGTPHAGSLAMLLAIGLLAAGLTIASFVAQTARIIRTRDVSGLSTAMWLLSTTAFALWVAYGVVLRQWPIIVPNAVCLVLAAFILVLKVLPARKRDQVADKLEEISHAP
jgi:MtN3 and saliva related transmembrane protein